MAEGTIARIPIKHRFLKGGQGTFLLDTGAQVNVIRRQALSPKAKIKHHRNIRLTGIGPGQMITQGTVTIKAFGHQLRFHILPDESPLTEDGMLGAAFICRHKAKLHYDLKVMEILGRMFPFEMED